MIKSLHVKRDIKHTFKHIYKYKYTYGLNPIKTAHTKPSFVQQTGWPLELEVVTMECGIHDMWRRLMTAT